MKRIAPSTSLPAGSAARFSRVLRGCLLAAASITAGIGSDSRSRWHVEAGPTLWANTNVHFSAGASDDPSTAPRTDRFYDDGFNRVDASGNVGDGPGGLLPSRTGFFAFTSDTQVNLGAGTLALHRLSAAEGGYVASRRPDRQPGFDLNVRYSLRRADARRDWGVEAGAGFARFERSRSGSEPARLRVLTDLYQLGGVVPQRAPYTGRFSPLPGDQRIGDLPTRSIATVAGTASGTRHFDARTWVARLGGWVEVLPGGQNPLASERDRWSVLLRGGPALFSTRARFSVDEQLQAPGTVGGVRVTAEGSRRRTSIGGFAGLRVRRVFTDRSALVVWGDLLHGPEVSVNAGPRRARLDLSSPVVVGAAFELRWGR